MTLPQPYRIARLCDYPEFAEICAQWDETEWPRTPQIEDFFSDHYRQAAAHDGPQLPQTWIALELAQQTGGHALRPVGMTSLIADDHPDFTELSPWLASAYVVPEYRGRGIFRALHNAAVRFARERMGLTHLYVYSPVDFTRLGNWQARAEISDPFEQGKTVTLFRNDL